MTLAGIEPGNKISYNGFTFDGTYTLDVMVNVIEDDAKRTVIYHEHTITVKATVVPDGNDGSTDKAMTEIRRKLGTNGGILEFKNRGFGESFTVNKGQIKDVKYGPKPRIISWKPVGDNLAAEIEWQVVTRFPVCAEAKFKGVLALNYEIGFAIDDKSNTTRTVSGYIEIAQTRQAGQQTIRDIADNYRDQINVLPLPGFKRKQTWNTTADKSRVDFSITDEQINSRNPWPQFCTDITARHDVSMTRGTGFAKSRNTLSAEIELVPGRPGALAWIIFLQMIESRILTARGDKNVVLLEALNASEDIFGRSSRFSVSYTILHCLEDFMNRTGLWRPLGTDWQRWATSVGPVFDSRGNAKLAAVSSDDAIISLCSGTEGGVFVNSPHDLERISSNSLASLQNDRPPPKRSWLAYQNVLQVFEDSPGVRQSIIQSPNAPPPKQDPNDTDGVEYETPSASEVTDDIYQQSGQPRYSGWLTGFAKRVGYPVTMPRITKIGGRDAQQVKSFFTQGSTTNMFGQVVFGGVWKLGYILLGSPGKPKSPDNVKECIDGETGKAAQPGKKGSS